MPAGVAKMSSSRIIKSSCMNGYSVRDFRFETIGGRFAANADLPCENGFVPFAGLDGSAKNPFEGIPDSEVYADDPVSEEAELVVEELRPCITEGELNSRLEEEYERGFEEGQRQAERGLSNVFKSLREAIEEIYSLREQIFRHSEEDLLKLSILVARKIIQQEVSQDRRILANVLTAALENAAERDEVIIRINPEDLKLVNSQKQISLSGISEDKLLNLKPDDTVTSGGCIVETQLGEIDARLERQLDEIFKSLTEERGELINSAPGTANSRETHAYQES